MRQRRRIRQLANKARARKPLKHSTALTASAQAKANSLAKSGRLAHGQWWREMYRHIRRNEWGSIAENIASGQDSAAEVHQDWMRSPGHRENILNYRYDHLGVGIAKARGGKTYYVQHFGDKK